MVEPFREKALGFVLKHRSAGRSGFQIETAEIGGWKYGELVTTAGFDLGCGAGEKDGLSAAPQNNGFDVSRCMVQACDGLLSVV
jgi:hypothetical protein